MCVVGIGCSTDGRQHVLATVAGACQKTQRGVVYVETSADRRTLTPQVYLLVAVLFYIVYEQLTESYIRYNHGLPYLTLPTKLAPHNSNTTVPRQHSEYVVNPVITIHVALCLFGYGGANCGRWLIM